MLDLVGSGYVVECCVSAIVSRNKQEAYMVYVTDCLRAIATGLGAKGVTRFADIIHPPKQDTRAPKDIVKDITAKAGLKVVKKHERIKPDGNAGS